MDTPLPVLLLDHLLPYLDGSVLKSLALSCHQLYFLISKTKQWQYCCNESHFPITLKRGLMIFAIHLVSGRNNDRYIALIDEYYQSGLPMSLEILSFKKSQAFPWLKYTTLLHFEGKNFDKVLEMGILPHRLKNMSIYYPCSKEILEMLTHCETLELHQNCTSLEALSCIKSLEILKLSDYTIDCRMLMNIEKLKTLKISMSCTVQHIQALGNLVNLEKLYLDSNVTDISFLESLIHLEVLSLGPNYGRSTITHLPSKCSTKLKILNLPACRLIDISWLSQCSLLEYVDIGGNELMSLDIFAGCPNLLSLNIICNQIANLEPLRNCKKLTTLNIRGNKIRDLSPLNDLPLSNFCKLSYSKNPIEKIPTFLMRNDERTFSFTKMKLLRLDATAEFLKRLTRLNLSSNQLIDISALKHATQLIELNLSENNLENIDALSKLQQLETLDLSFNRIIDIQPLKTLFELKTLNISTNWITEIDALANLTKLVTVDISENLIMTIPCHLNAQLKRKT